MDGGTTITMERPAAAGCAVVDVVGDRESRLRELDDRIGVLSAQIHALDAELVGVLAEYDAVGGWQGRGWRSFAHYLSVRTNFAPRDAERLVSIAARVDEMPSLIAAARGGQVSMGVLASAARVVTPENEARVLDVVRACTPRQAQRVLAAYRSLRPTPPALPTVTAAVMVLMVLLRMISSWITGGGTGSMTTAATGSTAPSTSSPENCSNKPDEPSSPKWNGPAPTHTPTSRLKLVNHPTQPKPPESGSPPGWGCRGGV
ncbi:MAG: DUF222 domain-containing protein [Microthrixaceae bacterium]